MAVSTQSSIVESVTSGGGGDWSSDDEDYEDYYDQEDEDVQDGVLSQLGTIMADLL